MSDSLSRVARGARANREAARRDLSARRFSPRLRRHGRLAARACLARGPDLAPDSLSRRPETFRKSAATSAHKQDRLHTEQRPDDHHVGRRTPRKDRPLRRAPAFINKDPIEAAPPGARGSPRRAAGPARPRRGAAAARANSARRRRRESERAVSRCVDARALHATDALTALRTRRLRRRRGLHDVHAPPRPQARHGQ